MVRLLEYIFVGGSLAFAAAAQPGPLQAFLLSRVAAVGWKRTLPASLAPIVPPRSRLVGHAGAANRVKSQDSYRLGRIGFAHGDQPELLE